MKEFSLTGTVCDFSVDHNALTIDLLNIYNCLVKKTYYKINFRFIKSVFVISLSLGKQTDKLIH